MNSLIRPGPSPIDNAMAMKTYLVDSSYLRPAPANRRTVYNGIQVEYSNDPPDSCLISPWKRQVGGEVGQSCCSCQSTQLTPSLSTIPTTTTTTTILVTATPPPITVTIPEPPTSVQCFAVGFAYPSVTLEVSLPSDAPSLFIYVPLADQQGEWTIDLGGPSSEEQTVAGTQVNTNQSLIPFNSTQPGSPFNWVSPAGTTGTVVEYLFQPNQGNLTFDITLLGSYPCTPPVICGQPQACNINTCNGTFNTDGTAQCSNGCSCLPVIPATCGQPELCNLYGCNGTFNIDGTAQCRDHFNGCSCIPVVPDTCGQPQACNLHNCGGTFNSDGTAQCMNNFNGCSCIPVIPDTCGQQQDCNLHYCDGTFNIDGTAQCRNNFNGCSCIPVIPDTCGQVQACNIDNCDGTFNPDGTSQCRNLFNGCPCIPIVPDTCGQQQDCNLHNCGGTFNSDGSAQCRNNFDGCSCTPVIPDTCGQPELCNLYGCAGGFGLDQDTAYCTGNFAGCVCNPVFPQTCGNIAYCSDFGCNGEFNADGSAAYCTAAYAGCQCTPTATTCGAPQPCSSGGCAGTLSSNGNAYCQGNYRTCLCYLPLQPTTTTSAPGGCNTIPGCAGGGSAPYTPPPTFNWGEVHIDSGPYNLNIMWMSGTSPCWEAVIINSVGQNPCDNNCIRDIPGTGSDCYQLGGCGGDSMWLLKDGAFYAGCQANTDNGESWDCTSFLGDRAYAWQMYSCAP
jgi:hypothetical protein